MNDKNLAEGKLLLKAGTPDSIANLEMLLNAEGFRKKIKASELSYAAWYSQHVTHEPYDRTDYLQAYEPGFIRINRTTSTIAAYGIIQKISLNAPVAQKFVPHHFFFMEDLNDYSDRLELIEYLAQKAQMSPKNPAKQNARRDKLESPEPQGSIPLRFGLLGAEIFALSVLSSYIPQVNVFDQSLPSAIITTGGLYLLNTSIVKTMAGKKLLKRMGYDDYEAPAGSSIIKTNYGILGLERYAFMFPDRD